jgi:hypothetical protein
LRHLLVLVVVLSVVFGAVAAGVVALLGEDVWYRALFVGGTVFVSQLVALLTVRLLRRDERVGNR